MRPDVPAPARYLTEAFGSGGHLARALPGYEARAGQLALAAAVDRALAAPGHLLAEGPCGTGKTFAYLVPAIHHARAGALPVLVATANIALQEQLVEKDLPLLARALPEPFAFALCKGRRNYVCQARLAEVRGDGRLFPDATPAEVAQLDTIAAWAGRTGTGDVSELDFEPAPALWQRVCGDPDECDGARCRQTACFAWQARLRARGAQVLVCNHHLLWSHLQVRAATGEDLVLPPFAAVIGDEGHRMAEIAREFLGFRASEVAMRRLVEPLRAGRRGALADALRDALGAFATAARAHRRHPDYRARCRTPGWADAGPLCGALAQAAAAFLELAEAAQDDQAHRRAVVRAAQAAALRTHVAAAVALDDPGWACWIELDQRVRVAVAGAPLDVAPRLRAELFGATPSVIVTSATLTTGGSFDWLRAEIGCEGGATLVADSPFDFQRQALLVTPPMDHDPDEPGFLPELTAKLRALIDAIGGRTLGLFTSYRHLHAVAAGLRGGPHRLLVQGDAPRARLLRDFATDVGSVLLGTASFWTGVDVPGEALSCLAIDRLPFPALDDPVMDALRDRDRDAFTRHFLPRAVLTLRQGVGRLIRATTDRGAIVLFDRRVTQKSYGRVFLRSLPPCRRTTHLEDVAPFLARAE